MEIKGIIAEDFINYKEPSMVIEFPYCTFKCDKDCGMTVCQNSSLVNSPTYDIPISNIIKFYMSNNITKAIVCQGLEPFDSDDLWDLLEEFRKYTQDTIIIYTGYTEQELEWEINFIIKKYKNIIIKFGRFIPNINSRYDDILGVILMSCNQYAKKIS